LVGKTQATEGWDSWSDFLWYWNHHINEGCIETGLWFGFFFAQKSVDAKKDFQLIPIKGSTKTIQPIIFHKNHTIPIINHNNDNNNSSHVYPKLSFRNAESWAKADVKPRALHVYDSFYFLLFSFVYLSHYLLFIKP
jgi:hypothetical protein